MSCGNCQRSCNCSKKIEWDYCTDFVVVGMGAGGAVVMRSLSDAGFKVMGIEAGPNYDTDPLILDSTNSGVLEPLYTWKFFYNQNTEPNPQLDNMTMNYTTGRLLGGGSSINGLQYVRSSNNIWQQWANLNGPDWGPVPVTNAYKSLENFLGVTGAYNPTVHGFTGPMLIRQAPITSSSMATKFATALATATGSTIISDYNDPSTPLGTFTRWSLFEQPNGNRASSSTDFLQPILHKIKLNTTINKVIISKSGKVKGIEAIHNGKSINIKARKEVILSCGIYSNEILQRSGIGPSPLLSSLGIPVVFTNNNVGSNSKNQLISVAIFSANPADFPGTGSDPDAIYTGGAFLPDPSTGADPNIRGFQWIGINPDPNTFIVAFYKLNPQSLGTDRLQDKDPLRISAVNENLFSNPADMESIINVFQQQITALNTQFQLIDPSYQLIVPSLTTIGNTGALTAYIKSSIDHAHHWTGTCTMAPLYRNGVVDNQGRVYGAKGLRVADISVAPIEPDGNTCGPAYLVGYNISQMIIKQYS